MKWVPHVVLSRGAWGRRTLWSLIAGPQLRVPVFFMVIATLKTWPVRSFLGNGSILMNLASSAGAVAGAASSAAAHCTVAPATTAAVVITAAANLSLAGNSIINTPFARKSAWTDGGLAAGRLDWHYTAPLPPLAPAQPPSLYGMQRRRGGAW